MHPDNFKKNVSSISVEVGTQREVNSCFVTWVIDVNVWGIWRFRIQIRLMAHKGGALMDEFDALYSVFYGMSLFYSKAANENEISTLSL